MKSSPFASRGLPPTLNHCSTAIFERGSGLSSARSHGPGRHPQGGAGPRLPTPPHGCACTRALFEPGCDYPSLIACVRLATAHALRVYDGHTRIAHSHVSLSASLSNGRASRPQLLPTELLHEGRHLAWLDPTAPKALPVRVCPRRRHPLRSCLERVSLPKHASARLSALAARPACDHAAGPALPGSELIPLSSRLWVCLHILAA